MAQVVQTFDATTLTGPDGSLYRARACGAPMPGGLWEGWIEFAPADGASFLLRTSRETTQPNRMDLVYWASGLTPVYLEGALQRALSRTRVNTAAEKEPLEGPAPAAVSATLLDPFSVSAKGEDILHQELRALAPWHLVNIIDAYALSAEAAQSLRRKSRDELVELIVAAVRSRQTSPSRQ